MKRMICTLTMAAALFSFTAHADDQAVVEEFFKAAKVKEKYEAGMMAGLAGSASALDSMPSIPGEEKGRIASMQEKIHKLMMDEMGWDKMKAEYAKLYLSVFSVDELKEMTALLKQPIAQKMLEKELELMPLTMKIGEAKTAELMPKIMQITMEAMTQQ